MPCTNWTIVTGGGDGIGAAMVLKLANLGHNIIVIDRDVEKLVAVTNFNPTLIKGVCADIAEKNIAELIAEALPSGDKVQYLIHNAALTPVSLFGEITYEQIDRMMAVNFTGPLMITQMLRDYFIPGARIIHIGTNLAHRPEYGLLGYCTSKAAFYQLYQQCRVELASRGVLVASVRTGAVNTASFRNGHQAALAHNLPISKLEDRVIEQGMLFEPEEAACFLSYVLTAVSEEEFVKPSEWDAYDKAHWSHWRC